MKGGVNILGATSSMLTISNLTVADSGAYAVKVSNASGSVTSRDATLNVVPQCIYSILGTVKYWQNNELKKLSGVTISDGTRTAVSDANGSYFIPNVPEGSYTLRATKPGYSISPEGFTNPFTNTLPQKSANFLAVDGDAFVEFSIKGLGYGERPLDPFDLDLNQPLTAGRVYKLLIAARDIDQDGQPTLIHGVTFDIKAQNATLGSWFTQTFSWTPSTSTTVRDNNLSNVVSGQDEPGQVSLRDDYNGLRIREDRESSVAVLYFKAGAAGSIVKIDFDSDQWNPGDGLNKSMYYILRGIHDSLFSRNQKIFKLNQGRGFVFQAPVLAPHVAKADPTGERAENLGGFCLPGATDCIFEELEPSACAEANGFLNMTNIASVLNLRATALKVNVIYRDLLGKKLGSVSTELGPNAKQDYIVNDLGLLPDTVGTVCVETNANDRGGWSGDVKMYKPNTRPGGSGFDFVTSYLFTNSRKGEFRAPLNTFHIGTDPGSLVANWLSIADANTTDGKGVRGTIRYYNDQGEMVHEDKVDLPNGGRFNFPGHDAISPTNGDAIGLARFVPKEAASTEYYASLTRLFYDCGKQGICNDFLTGFVVPERPAFAGELAGDVSTVDGLVSVIELNNPGELPEEAQLRVFAENGSQMGEPNSIVVPVGATRHVVVSGSSLGANVVGSAIVSAKNRYLSALNFFYKLDDAQRLRYAFAAPMVSSPGMVQIADFNSFIENKNSVQLFNPLDQVITGNVSVLGYDGKVLESFDLNLAPHAATRTLLSVPKDTYGTIILNASKKGLVMRNYTSGNEYTLTSTGQ